MLDKIIRYTKNPRKLIITLAEKGIIILPDFIFLKLVYKEKMGKTLDLKNPKTFNEKLQWLKLHDRKEIYSTMVDKYEVKGYVAKKIGQEYMIPTLGIYDKFEDIDFNKLPNQFVLKCTHDSGGVYICTDKTKMKKDEVKEIIKKSLKKNYYLHNREWAYKNIKPRIIAETYMKDGKTKTLNDYKLFCFHGKVETILVCSNRNKHFKNTDFYDKNWNLMPFTRKNHKNNKNGIEKPKNLDKMIEIAEILSKDIPFIRVDLYEINNQVYFGELTLYPSGGFEGFKPEEWDKKLGDILKINRMEK